MRIQDGFFQANNRLFVTVRPKNSCKIEFAGHLWLPFIDQPHSDAVVSSIINFQIYKILLIEWKHGIGPNDIITFNEEL